MKLVPPSARHRDSFLRAADAFAREGLPWWQGPRLELARRDFDAFVREKLAEAERGTPARPPKTHRWAIVQDVFVGRIAVFHHLTDALRRVGGHIGYDTHPEHRGRGYATQMLGQMLPVARTLGLQRVLLTCDASNLASVTPSQGCRPLPGSPYSYHEWSTNS